MTSTRAPRDAITATARLAAALVIAVIVVYVLHYTAQAFLLAFAAILLAVAIAAPAATIERWIPMPRAASLTLVIVALMLFFSGAAWLIGSSLVAQAALLADQLPSAADAIEEKLAEIGSTLFPMLEDASSDNETLRSLITGALSRMLSWGTSLVNLLGALVLVICAAIYLAARPRTYVRGLLKLAPERVRPSAGTALVRVHRSLALWIKGKIISMVLVGALAAAAAWAIGLPAPLVLGLFMGLCEFVPIIGPIVAAVPALVLAAGMGAETFAWALAANVAIQQVESNLVTPRINDRMLELPPGLFLFSVMAFGLLFGLLGLLLAAPLAVVVFVLVNFWIERRAEANETG
jgi:predicted PurR-regulated permease PerM